MKTPRLLNDLLARITEAGHSLTGHASEDLGERCEALLSGRGEATGLALAAEIFARYQTLDADGKRAFFLQAAERFGVDETAIQTALDEWRMGGDARALHAASEPRSQELLRRLNRVPGGTRALVAMRRDLLEAAKHAPELHSLDGDFRHLLTAWFNRGFLELQRINWASSAEVLEKIIAYEAVHAIAGWEDLRARVAAPDRRLYAFFHPALANDPLIFVEVALTDAVPSAIAPILHRRRRPLQPQDASVAVFYSISNCQAGLRGISFGSFLIKQVVEELRGELAGLKKFVTLSPLPGLRKWARGEAAAAALPDALNAVVPKLDADSAGNEDALRELAARYLLTAKDARGRPLDHVARFHLGNGARLQWLHPRADRSSRGRGNSWGAMANYLYDLGAIERNHEAFFERGKVAAAAGVRRLVR